MGDDVQDGEQRWRARPVLAYLIIAVVRLVPLVASFAAGIVLGNLTGRPAGLLSLALWLGGLLVVSTVVMLVFERIGRRFLPLAGLLKLTMLVPDKTPSRFRVALKANNSGRLLKNPPDDPGAAAGMVLGLVSQLNAHDRSTRGHSERVRAYADLVGEEMGLSERDRDLLRWAALLHDIGKLEVPGSILNKPGRPTPDEWDCLKRHPVEGSKIITPLKPWLGRWASAVVQHHERYDGTGYPMGLAGHHISLSARIVSVADSFDVMTAIRAYKKRMPATEAREELVRCAGTQFDPVVVRAFLRVSLGRLRLLMGPLAWLAEQPFLAGVGQAGARVAAAGGRATVGLAAVTAAAGASVSAGIPIIVEDKPPTVATSVPVESEVQGNGVIDVFLRNRFFATTTSTSTTSSTTSTTTPPTTVP
jgi:putative nucleotidyltransferase with HDIG domain